MLKKHKSAFSLFSERATCKIVSQFASRKTLNLTRSTKNVQDTLVTKDTLLKSDKSPVTVADLSAQSLISLHLLAHFQDPIIGEEDTSELRVNEPLRQRVVGLVNAGFKNEEGWGKDKTYSEEE